MKSSVFPVLDATVMVLFMLSHLYFCLELLITLQLTDYNIIQSMLNLQPPTSSLAAQTLEVFWQLQLWA